MPLYDYRCVACGREVEVMHGIHDVGPDACEACGGAMSKVLSPPAIHFKGSGWAKKDAAASTARKAKPKGSSTTSDTDARSSDAPTKSDAASKATSGGKSEVKVAETSSGSD
jgi:putative FmdB family regulatory protein